MPVDMRMRVLQVAKVDDEHQTMTVEMAIGLAWIEPRWGGDIGDIYNDYCHVPDSSSTTSSTGRSGAA